MCVTPGVGENGIGYRGMEEDVGSKENVQSRMNNVDKRLKTTGNERENHY